MSTRTIYNVNGPKVVHELFDDEAVIVDLDSGNYYSLEGVGAQIWQAMLAGDGTEEIVSSIQIRYDAGQSEIEAAVVRLFAELESEGLVAAVGDNGSAGEKSAEVAPSAAPPATKMPFVAPTLSRFTDMQDLLLLDPIHEVDESGWPNLPTE